ncbi:MAG: O-antigen ligase family protein [Flavipsychrobacter sp.]|nr:O-antigen ligase family protein [Flavipsychrobacter sp.]
MQRKAVDTWAARLLMTCFFMPMLMQVITLLAIALYFLVASIVDKYKAPLNDYRWALALGSCFCLFLFWFPVTPDNYKDQFFLLLQHRLSYLLMPFFFAVISPASKALIRAQLNWFVYGCITICVLANAMYVGHYYLAPGAAQPLFHVEYRMYLEHITEIHPTYLSMFICFAICILLLAKQEPGRRVWPKYAALYLLFIFLFCLLAKAAIIALCIILLHYAYLNRHRLARYKLQLVGGIAALAAAMYIIPFSRQRLGEVFQFAGVANKGGDISDNSMYVRKLVWNTDMQMLHRYWLGGVGPGLLKRMLDAHYFFFSVSHSWAVGYYNTHNEYLNEWLSFGLAGIVLLVVALAIHLVSAVRRMDYLYLYLLIILCVTFFTETVLARQYGVVFYAVLTSLFFFSREGEQELV